MDTIAITIGGAGVFLLWAAVTGRSPVDTLRSALNGQAIPGRTVVTVAPQRVAVGQGPAAPLQSGAVGRTAGADAGTGDQGQTLAYIGQGGHRLDRGAAAAFLDAERRYQGRIMITDSYRSAAQQRDVKARKPTLAATPGTSFHERGQAVDVATPPTAKLVASMEAAGWARFNPSREPWHWSHGGVG